MVSTTASLCGVVDDKWVQHMHFRPPYDIPVQRPEHRRCVGRIRPSGILSAARRRLLPASAGEPPLGCINRVACGAPVS
jgi:hypothetical protein